MSVTTYSAPNTGSSGGRSGWADSQLNTGASPSGLNYPSPFLRFESIYLPSNMKELFTLIAHAYMTDPNVNPAIENMSAYPITHLVFDKPAYIEKEEDFEPVRSYWKTLLEDRLDVRTFNISMGYDFWGYGNSFCSVYQPFDRWLKCTNCGKEYNTKQKSTKWKWHNLKFKVECSHCGVREATFFDKPLKTVKGVSLIKWNPFNIEIKYNSITGKSTYTYVIPSDIKAAIIKGDPSHILEDPEEFITAVVKSVKGRSQCMVVFDEDQIFAMQRPSMSLPGSSCVGWGMPNITSGLRDIFFKNIMRRAQAMVLHEHIIPFRLFSPQAVEQPSALASLGTWRSHIESSIKKWRKDPLTITTSPIPINVQQIGAQGKALTLFAEMAETDKSILKSQNIPREFVEGGLQYSGSSVSLRMLENTLLDYVQRSERLVNWLIKKISIITGVTAVDAKYLPFKMADDIQLKSLYGQLVQAGLVSNQKMGDIMDYNALEEAKIVAEEKAMQQVDAARAQAKAAMFMQNIQQEYATAMPTVMGNMQNPVNPQQSSMMSQQLQAMPPEQQGQALDSLGQQDPYLAQTVASNASTSNNELAKDIMHMENLPPEQAAQAMEQLYYANPKKYQLLKLFFSPSVAPQQAQPTQPRPAATPTAPATPPPNPMALKPLGMGGNTGFGGVKMTPASEKLPPRSAFRSM